MIIVLRDNSIVLRRAFTLVELLVTITILTLLASIVLFGMAGVQEQARDRRARAQIARIHNLIAEKWQSYDTRRVQLRPDVTPPSTAPAGMHAFARLAGIRELLRMELPDRITDVADNPVFLRDLPTLTKSYRNVVLANSGLSGWTSQHQGAECLYMVLSRIYVSDSNGLQFFTEQEIGDVDTDGMPEILDPWGNPVEFLRWAPGLTSPAGGGQPGGFSALQGNNPLENWDAFDPMHADGDLDNPAVAIARAENADLFDDKADNEDQINSNFAMFPLIFSAGPDGEYNIAVGLKSSSGHVPLHYNGIDSVKPDSGYANDPYASFTEPGGKSLRMGQVGDVTSDGHIDNITNHLVEAP